MATAPAHIATAADLRPALDQSGIVRWDRRLLDDVCAVDIDWKLDNVDQVNEHSIHLVSKAIVPYCRLLWRTKHGYRGITYKEQIWEGADGIQECTISAHELGAIAAWAAWRAVPDVIDKVELLNITRTPTEICACMTEREFDSHNAASELLYWREGLSNSNLTEDEINEWLSDNGYGNIGSRHNHSRCPIDPCNTSGNDPVIVTETGIRCFRCDGVYSDGFRSFANLLQGVTVHNEYFLRNMVLNNTHWGHAKYVLKHHMPCMPDNQVKLFYAGAMKLGSPDVLKWPLISDALRQEDMPRTESLWLNTDFSVPTGKGQSERIRTLPACKFVNDKGKLESSAKRSYILMGNDANELRKIGYYPIRPIGYCDLGRSIRQNESSIIAQSEGFRYIKKEIRTREIDQWEYLANSFPSIDQKYVKVLFCSVAWSQVGQGEPPQLIVTGPSGAGKSLTPEIVCHLLNGRYVTFNPSRNIETVLQQIVDNQTATLLGQDETFKTVFDPAEYITIMNRIKPGSIARKLYVGQIPITQVPPIVSTDVSLPDIFRMNEQISRRSVMINLLNPATTDWRDSSGGIENWSKHPLTEMCRANILSEMLDTIEELYNSGCNTFIKMAKALGAIVGSENMNEELSDRIQKIVDLYKDIPLHTSTRYPAAMGWRQFPVKGQSEGYGTTNTERLGFEIKGLISDLTGEDVSDIMTGEKLVKLLDPIHAKVWTVGDAKVRIEVRVNKRQGFVRLS